MEEREEVPTQELWRAIEENARAGQRKIDWCTYLDSIRVLCSAIDERIEPYQRHLRTTQLLGGREIIKVLEHLQSRQKNAFSERRRSSSMKDFMAPTSVFWEAIELNAKYAPSEENWAEHLDNIKLLCEVIDERIQQFQRQQLRKKLRQDRESHS